MFIVFFGVETIILGLFLGGLRVAGCCSLGVKAIPGGFSSGRCRHFTVYISINVHPRNRIFNPPLFLPHKVFKGDNLGNLLFDV